MPSLRHHYLLHLSNHSVEQYIFPSNYQNYKIGINKEQIKKKTLLAGTLQSVENVVVIGLPNRSSGLAERLIARRPYGEAVPFVRRSASVADL